MNEIVHDAVAPASTYGAIDRFLRNRLIERLARLSGGSVVVQDALGEVVLGEAVQAPIRVAIDSPAFYRAVAANGSVGAGEAYMDGAWRCDDLVALVRLLVRNRDLLDAMERGPARLGGFALRGWHALRPNTRTGARRNIAAHYDLGNAFFSTFLSDDLMYSSALYAGERDTLETASERKLARICDKLRLLPGQRVLEIGTGWGGFALHAARHHGCHVTTATISREQHALARERVRAAGLDDLIDVRLCDYRDLAGRFDRVVSIEMVEAIGASQLDAFFAKVSSLLAPDGSALVQAITIEDHRYAQALRSVDFIKRHVFPGSFIPSIAALVAAKARSSDLALVHLEDFGASYARTLQDWRTRFLARVADVRAQGFDERFVRLWEFYLAYCEGGFRERSIGVAQMLLAKPACHDAEYLAGLRQVEA